MKTQKYSICLTGHYPKEVKQYMENGSDIYSMHNPYWKRVIAKLCQIIKREMIVHPGGLTLHSNLALGANTAWAAAIMLAKRHYGDRITFIVDYIPDQSNHWSKQNQAIWHKIVSSADLVKCAATGKHNCDTIENCNLQMIKACHTCIAFWSGKPYGDTANCVLDARKFGLEILRLDPRDFAVKLQNKQAA